MEVNKLNRYIPVLNWTAVITMVICTLMVFFYAPTEKTMGNVQRILYFHVGSAWVGSVAFFVALLGGVLYLRKPDKKWDAMSLASVEIGIVFLSMAIAAGSIWGKPAWNTWWEWTPRLTLVTVAWLTYVAYFMLRGAIEDEDKRARFSAVYVMAAFVTILMTILSIRILRDIHPVVVGGTLESAQGISQGESEFETGFDSAKMGITLTVSTITFSVLYAAWLLNRMKLQTLMDEAHKLKMRLVAGSQ
jgi:heme exporter protein C